MATLNGREVSFENKSYVEIGELLLDASPNGDGVGLVLKLTLLEDLVFKEVHGVVGQAIAVSLRDAIRERGGNPGSFFYTYSDQIFETEYA